MEARDRAPSRFRGWQGVLLLLILNLVWLGLWWGLPHRWTPDASGGVATQLLSSDWLAAERVGLRGTGLEQHWRWERTAGATWSLREPFVWQAHAPAVRELLQQLVDLEVVASFSVDALEREGRSLRDYGLDPAQVELRLAAGNGSSLQLQIGTVASVADTFYVHVVGDERIHVVEGRLMELLAQRLDVFLERDVFTLPVAAFEEIAIESLGAAGARVLVRREAQGRWTFRSPLRAEVDAEALDVLLGELSQLRIGRFLAPGGGQPPALEPQLRILVSDGNTRELLEVGSAFDVAGRRERLARREGSAVLFSVAAEPLERWARAQELLRQRRILQIEPEVVTTLTLSEHDNNGRQLRLERVDGPLWQVRGRAPSGAQATAQPADPQRVRRLLERLSQLEVTAFVSDAPSQDLLQSFGLEPARTTLTLESVSGPPQTLLLGGRTAMDDGGRYVRRGGQPSVYRVEAAALEGLQFEPLAYRDRQLRSLPGNARLESVRWQRQEAPVSTLQAPSQLAALRAAYAAAPGAFRSLDQAADPGPPSPFSALQSRLKGLSAERFLGAEEATTTEDAVRWQYALQLVWALPTAGGASRRNEYWLFSRPLDSGERLGAFLGTGEVFVLETGLEGLFTRFEGTAAGAGPPTVPVP